MNTNMAERIDEQRMACIAYANSRKAAHQENHPNNEYRIREYAGMGWYVEVETLNGWMVVEFTGYQS